MHMNKADEYIFVFSLDHLRIGVFLKDVQRAIRAIAVSPLPGAPSIVTGIINVEGKIIPVVNIRETFNLKKKAISLTQKIAIVNRAETQIGLFVDDIIGLVDISNEAYAEAEELIPGSGKTVEYVQ